jgi:acyl carrier protein
MSEDLLSRFTRCAVETLDVEASKVTREARFAEDLDADSLDVVQLVMELEDEFGIEIPEEELKDVKTVGEALDLVAAKI